jgi:Rrf2 family protein
MKRSSRLSIALHALVHLAAQPDAAQTSTTLSVCLMTNPVVVRRVMGELREAGIVASTKGHNGGWRLLRPVAEITLFDVYAALGESLLLRTESDPGDQTCMIVRSVDQLMGDFLTDAEALLAARLKRVSLAEIAAAAALRPHNDHGVPSHG